VPIRRAPDAPSGARVYLDAFPFGKHRADAEGALDAVGRTLVTGV